MKRSDIIKYSLMGIAGIAIIILCVSFVKGIFGKTDNPDYSKEVIKAKDETIKVLQDNRQDIFKLMEKVDAERSEHEKKDSLLNQLYLLNQKKYKTNDAKMAEIPAYIDRISGNSDSIRAAFTNFQ